MAFKIKNNTYVLVRRNSDDVELTLPYRTFDAVRFSLENADGNTFRKLTLLAEVDVDGNPMPGNPNLSDEDKKDIATMPDPALVDFLK